MEMPKLHQLDDLQGARSRPAVISTETGTRLDEYRRFRHVVRNVYTHSFDPVKLGKPVHSAPELLHEQKQSCLPLPLFSNTNV